MKRPRAKKPPDLRFWQLVLRGERDACWLWGGAVASDTGYGIFNNGEKAVLAHVFSFELTRPGIDRTGLVVRHRCDKPLCVNPRHLQLGTHADNTRDMDERGRRVSNPVRGEAHYASKLNPDKVREIRRLAAEGPPMPIKSIAAMYGVSETTIGAIINRRTWRHV